MMNPVNKTIHGVSLSMSGKEMNVINAIRDYVYKIIESVPGMKVLMLDHETAAIVGMTVSKGALSAKEVYLFELIETPQRDTLQHLKAVCILRPTRENLRILATELAAAPKYGQYNLFFTNFLTDADVALLADADHQCAVEQVQEFYADYYAVNSDTFSLNFPRTIYNNSSEKSEIVEASWKGISAAILSLKKKPYIRYQKNSDLCATVAAELWNKMNEPNLKGVYDTTRPDQPVLLILDRRDDPVTPLLHQWTYQAMVHELIGLHNNLAVVGKEKEEIVLAPEFDKFYEEQMYNNFGEFGEAINAMRQEYLNKSKVLKEVAASQALDKLKDFIESDLAEHKKFTANFAKHIGICDELSRLVSTRNLMDVSELEQDLAVKNDYAPHLQRLTEMIANPKLDEHDKIKAAMLFALRYETSQNNNTIPQLTQMLLQHGVSSENVKLISSVLKWAGASVRIGDLFSNKNLWASSKSFIKAFQGGAEHNLLAHKPLLNELVEQIASGKLAPTDFPYIGPAPRDPRVTDMIIFIIGGITYEEARAVHEINTAKQGGLKVVLGGTTIHNSSSFLAELRKLM